MRSGTVTLYIVPAEDVEYDRSVSGNSLAIIKQWNLDEERSRHDQVSSPIATKISLMFSSTLADVSKNTIKDNGNN